MKIFNIHKGSLLLSLLICKGFVVSSKHKEFSSDEHKYNVLFIIADDLNTDLGCFDDSIVQTPNLDRLSQRAVRFEKAYCQYPYSGPSRASLLSGYSPNKTKIFDLRTQIRDNFPSVVTLPQAFKNNGYFTARVGKVYHQGVPGDIGKPGHDDPASWDIAFNPIGIDRTNEEGIINYTPNRTLGSSLSFKITEGTDDEHTDGIGANIACKLIRDNKNKPFFIAMGFYRPHCPYIAPRKYFELYPLDQIKLPYVPENDWEHKPVYAKFTNPLNWDVEEDKLKEVKRAYYASVSFMDAQIGKLLDTLEEEGLTDKTIIVFCSDNGYNLGQHGMWKKQSLFEQSARVPLIISVPGLTNKNVSSNRVVELQDIYPTLVMLCNLKEYPDDLDGNPLTPLLMDPTIEWNETAYSMVVRKYNSTLTYMSRGESVTGRSIRTERYRYTEWDEGIRGGELYDYESDPNEYENLYDKIESAPIRAQLSSLLRDRYIIKQSN